MHFLEVSCSSRQDASKYVVHTYWSWKVNVRIWSQVKVTWVHVSSQVGLNAYQSMRLCERNTLGPFLAPYLYSTKRVRGKKRMWLYTTSNDPKERSLGQNCIRVIDSILIYEYLEINNSLPFVLSEKNGIWTFFQCLLIVRFQNWPHLRLTKSKFRDVRFVGTDTFINSGKFNIYTLKTVITAQS